MDELTRRRGDAEDLALTLAGRKKRLLQANFFAAMGLTFPEKGYLSLGRRLLSAAESWSEPINSSFIPLVMKVELQALIEERRARLS